MQNLALDFLSFSHRISTLHPNSNPYKGKRGEVDVLKWFEFIFIPNYINVILAFYSAFLQIINVAVMVQGGEWKSLSNTEFPQHNWTPYDKTNKVSPYG